MATPNYDSLEFICNEARVRLNDAIASIGGDILTDNQPFTIQACNNGWRRMQEKLQQLGFLRFTVEKIYSNLGAVSGTDQALQPYLSWAGYYNGSSLSTANVLPQDFISPERLDERIHGTSTDFLFMEKMLAGLPLVSKAYWNRIWEWRDDAIWFPGALSAFDLRVRYKAFLDDFVANTDTPFAAQPVPIMRCADSFSSYLAYEIAAPRADLDATAFLQAGDDAAAALAQRENPITQFKPAGPQ